MANSFSLTSSFPKILGQLYSCFFFLEALQKQTLRELPQNLNNIFFIYKLEQTKKDSPEDQMGRWLKPPGPQTEQKVKGKTVEKKSQRKKRAPPSSLPMEGLRGTRPHPPALLILK